MLGKCRGNGRAMMGGFQRGLSVASRGTVNGGLLEGTWERGGGQVGARRGLSSMADRERRGLYIYGKKKVDVGREVGRGARKGNRRKRLRKGVGSGGGITEYERGGENERA